MVLVSEDGSAVKKSKRGKTVIVWVEKAPKQLLIGRQYMLPNYESDFPLDPSSPLSDSLFAEEMILI